VGETAGVLRGRRAGSLLAAMTALLVLAGGLTGCALFDRRVDVLLIGDSIMVQSGPFVGDAVARQPGVGTLKTKVEAINGTGLLTPGLTDWQAKASELIDRYQPKVVVVLFIGNYTDTDLWTGADGRPVPNEYGPDFYREWGAQAEKLTATLSSRGATVDWVLPPPLAGDEGARREGLMRQTYTELAQRVPSVGLIDGRAALGGDDGEWVWRRPGVDGGEVTVRAADSVHLTDDGGRLMARQMAETVAPQLIAARTRTP
jgi:hypothetical protein